MSPASPGQLESFVDKSVYMLKMAEIGAKARNLKHTMNWQATRTSAANTVEQIRQTSPKFAVYLEAEHLGEIDRLKPGHDVRLDEDPKLKVAREALIIQACKDPKTGPQFSLQLATADHKRYSEMVRQANLRGDLSLAQVTSVRLQIAYEAKQEQLTKR